MASSGSEKTETGAFEFSLSRRRNAKPGRLTLRKTKTPPKGGVLLATELLVALGRNRSASTRIVNLRAESVTASVFAGPRFCLPQWSFPTNIIDASTAARRPHSQYAQAQQDQARWFRHRNRCIGNNIQLRGKEFQRVCAREVFHVKCPYAGCVHPVEG